MSWFKATWYGVPKVLIAALGLAAAGSCSLITSVDRDEIPVGGGGPYEAAQGARPEMTVRQTRMDLQMRRAGQEPETAAVEFVWEEVAARPVPYDLSMELEGAKSPMLQVFTVGDQPFVRVSTLVQDLDPGVPYRAEVTREGSVAWARLVRSDDSALVIEGPVVPVGEAADSKVVVVTAKDKPHVQVLDVATWQGYGTN